MSKDASFICIAAIIIISILFCFIPTNKGEEPTEPSVAVVQEEPTPTVVPTPEPTATPKIVVVTELQTEESEKFLWETLNKYTENEYITAGIMGMFWRESGFRSDAVAGWASNDARNGTHICEEFTDKVDEGLLDGSSKDYFIEYVRYKYGGYGLCQWSHLTYIEPFYDFAQEWGTSIADAEMQCAFIVQSLQNQTPELWEMVISDTNAKQVGRNIGSFYDSAGQGSDYMGYMAQEYYNKYSEEIG